MGKKSDEILARREKILEVKQYVKYNDIILEFGEPDKVVTGNGYLIILYTLNNNRIATLNFGNGTNLMQLIETYIIIDGTNSQNIIFNF